MDRSRDLKPFLSGVGGWGLVEAYRVKLFIDLSKFFV